MLEIVASLFESFFSLKCKNISKTAQHNYLLSHEKRSHFAYNDYTF